jgi:hypothetical protein
LLAGQQQTNFSVVVAAIDAGRTTITSNASDSDVR